jgi:hypothetical protein
MKLPNFYEFEPLNSIKAMMGIPRNVYGTLRPLVTAPRLTELELRILASNNGLDISVDELVILPDGTLAYKNSRVILYIRDVNVYGNQQIQPRFHLSNCTTLQQMRQRKRFDRYVVSTRTDGCFNINIIDGNRTRMELYDLSVCQNCLNLLSFDGFMMRWSQQERIDFVKRFKIDRFFDKYPKSLHIQPPNYNSDNAPLNTYSEDFKTISQNVRNASGWYCQRCGVNLSAPTNRKWLHVHHINGLKHDNSSVNLEAICIGCHAEKPNHGHIKNNTDYKEFLITLNWCVNL